MPLTSIWPPSSPGRSRINSPCGSPSIAQLIRTESRVMKGVTGGARRCGEWAAVVSTCSLMLVVAATGPASAAGCAFEPQGEGRVVEIIDARSFRLHDSREVRLDGIEPIVTEKASRTSALSAIILNHEVSLRGGDDTPDRYGRQPAFVFLASSGTLVQAELLARGQAMVAGSETNKDCASILTAAKTQARDAKRGIWGDPTAIKNAESPGDILTGIGRFTVVEGRVLSVRQARATTYLNFGRNWTRGFAVTISRRVVPAFEAAAGTGVKSLENRRIRVRGFVEARGGPRVELLGVGQVELLGGN